MKNKRRKTILIDDNSDAVRYLVAFKINEEMPLIGPGDSIE